MKKRSLKVALLTAALSLVACLAFANEKCKECHADIVAKHATTLHGKAGKNCAACHGGVEAHLASGDKKDIITFGKGDSKAQNSQCLACHNKNQKLMFWGNSKHSSNDIACVSCHKIHKGKSPKVSEPETCFECHKDVKTEASRFSHHPIIEGKVKCSDCHNVHGSLGHGEIKAANVNQLCYKCHAEKRGPFVYEHPPVEENCLKCHGAHGTKSPKLTLEKMPNLCQNCHEGTSHPTSAWSNANGIDASIGRGAVTSTLGNGATVTYPARPTQQNASGRFFGRSCVNCHQTIHGTNAPAGKRFVR